MIFMKFEKKHEKVVNFRTLFLTHEQGDSDYPPKVRKCQKMRTLKITENRQNHRFPHFPCRNQVSGQSVKTVLTISTFWTSESSDFGANNRLFYWKNLQNCGFWGLLGNGLKPPKNRCFKASFDRSNSENTTIQKKYIRTHFPIVGRDLF